MIDTNPESHKPTIDMVVDRNRYLYLLGLEALHSGFVKPLGLPPKLWGEAASLAVDALDELIELPDDALALAVAIGQIAPDPAEPTVAQVAASLGRYLHGWPGA
jgi:hypothetical protein